MGRILAILVLVSTSAAAQVPRDEVVVAGPPTDALEPAVASDGDVTAVCWSDFVTNVVRVSVSDAGGLEWSVPERLDADMSGAVKATEIYGVHVAGDDVYVAWCDERFGASQDEVYFNRSTNAGASWVGEARVDHGLLPNVAGVRDWRLAVSPDTAGDHVYFLLSIDPNPGSDEDLYLVASHDGGATFSPSVSPTALPAGTADVDDIDLAVDGMSVYVVWRDDRFGSDDEVFFQRSTDGGATWLANDVVLSTIGDGLDADDEVQVAVAGATIAVAMQEDSTCCSAHELRVTVSTNGGTTWSGAQKVGSYTTNIDDVDLREQSLVVLDSGEVVVAWGDDRLAGLNVNEVYVSRSTDSGATWGADPRLSVANGGAPRLAKDGGRIVATWPDGSAVDQVAATFTEDAGATWSVTTFLPSPTGFDIDDPHVVINPLLGNVICAWLSDPFGTRSVYAGGYTLCVEGAPPASSVIRNGTGVNPLTLAPVADVQLGATWAVDLDCGAHGPGFAFLLVWTVPTTVGLTVGEVLGTGKIARLRSGHAGDVIRFSAGIPNDPAFCGLTVISQGACVGDPGPQLSNAIDHLIGR